ncbi:tripartite tricarboxylate transporter TctB family protein [Teichococcus aestuarii]|uniref:tripartite tricarboxylate transporter TctB family protein n=1 Tax=Teichococcus aestuarii TaxID=568898 RepID=UPI00361CD001
MSRPTPFLWRDRRVALAVAAVALAFLAGTFSFDAVPAALMEGMGASEFPRLVGFVILLLALVLALQPAPAEEEALPAINRCGWATFAACLAFLVVLALAGMLVAMFAFMVGVGWLWGERRPGVLLASAGGMVLCLWLLLVRVFGLTLPGGLLGDMLFN